MRIINKQNILDLFDYGELVDEIIEALKKMEEGRITMPSRMHVDFAENNLLLMPCSDGEYFATKLVSVCPKNSTLGLPIIYGSVFLNGNYRQVRR